MAGHAEPASVGGLILAAGAGMGTFGLPKRLILIFKIPEVKKNQVTAA
jgi:hypothetical protein